MECEFCKSNFKNLSILNNHKNTAKYCKKIQESLNIEITNSFTCEFCDKKLSQKVDLQRHYLICKKKSEVNIENKYKERETYLENQIIFYKSELDKKDLIIKELQDSISNIALQGNIDKQSKIDNLVKKYVKKVPRVQFTEKNVIYILTTDRLEKDNIYIIGKAKNLTNRLSTYNKTDEHRVVYCHECSDENIMNVVENMVITKLTEYKERANRDRFILPKDTAVDIFINTIKDSANFFSL